MSNLPPVTGYLLGNTVDDIVGTAWLLGHDLKSPVSLIISAMEVLISLYEDDEAMADTLPMIRGALAAANREHNMVSDMLDLARLETNTYELERQSTDMVELVRTMLELESYSISIKQLKVEVDLPDTALMCSIDAELVRRVFSALVDNTIKFTVRDDLLEVKAVQAGDKAIITFTDNGRMISPEFEPQLLERAPQWDKRLAGSRTSVGLGLPFAHHVALAHQGTFSGRSDEATGKTTFTLTLPLIKTDQAQSEANNG